MKRFLPLVAALFTLAAAANTLHAQAAKPIKILLLTGGCCHDYAKQKDILKKGIESRMNAVVDHVHSDDTSTKPRLASYGNPDYAKGYDVVVHDECSADITDPAIIAGVLKPHVDGIPGVNLHCAMHSYRFGDYRKPVTAGADNAKWFEYIGIQSTGHGPQEPITVSYTDKTHPITKNLADWTTSKEELYNNVQIFPTAKALATGTQKDKPLVLAWTNMFGNTRVFSTTLAHNTSSVEDPRYLDLVANGILWATDKLGDDGKPKAGFAAEKK
ncbi:MAG TPA: ThuA domain-containing protein [Chthoniobacteraceae bacterium]|jgi:hypothetical protein